MTTSRSMERQAELERQLLEVAAWLGETEAKRAKRDRLVRQLAAPPFNVSMRYIAKLAGCTHQNVDLILRRDGARR